MADIKRDTPFVLVLCMTYNHEKYIENALNGFVMQKTNFPFVVAVIDDASTDNNAQVIIDYLQRVCDADAINSSTEEYGKVIDVIPSTNSNCLLHVVLLNENHYGKKSKRPYYAQYEDNVKYIATCEGDDYWTNPNKLQKQVDFMETHPKSGICYTDYNMQYDCNPNIVSSLFESHSQYRPETYEQHLLRPGYLAPMTWLFRRELQEMLTNSKIYTDGTYAYMLEFMHNTEVAYLPFVSATYRSHVGSASSPIGAKALYKYTKGVFDTQRYYSEKYSCSNELKTKIMLRGYLDVLPIAVMAVQEDFIEEARLYFKSQDLDIDLVIRELKQGEMRRQSKAYRLGKAILKPFKRLKEKLK